MSSRRKVLITGASGQLGAALLASAPAGVHVTGLGHSELDIGDPDAVSRVVAALRPDAIVNAAAYTAVDRAETEPQQARRANAQGPANLAQAARDVGALRMIHVSTDFVFDGSGSTPYRPDDAPAPLGVYGSTKLEGEREVLRLLHERSCTVRTAWVYSATGANFVKTMLRLMKERGQVRVVCDQIGTPTSVASLATALWRVVDRNDLKGVLHWTDAGVASWYDFAVAIAEEATAAGLLSQSPRVTPITTAEYPTPARRPAYSVLDSRAAWSALDLEPVHWRVQLRQVIAELASA